MTEYGVASFWQDTEWRVSITAGTHYAQSIECARDPGHVRSGPRIGPLIVELPSRVADFMVTWEEDILVSERALEVLRRNAIRGFDIREIEIAGRTPTGSYRELIVTGWGGMATPASGIQLAVAESCRECGLLRYTGLTNAERLVDVTQRDESDIFVVWPLPKYRLLSPRAVSVVRQAELTGVAIRNLAALNNQHELRRSIGPGRLSYWMPASRAHFLGAPLGIE
jgi:hypothetical protein